MEPAIRPECDGVIEIDGRDVAVTSLDRVMFPDVGFTKGDLVAYYARAAAKLLPHTSRGTR